jgi:peroxiredoxin Q/BCP
MIAEGEKAPAFSLAGGDGKTISLSDFAGKRFVLYFYPKDDTPGCTIEACGFRDKLPDFSALGVPVVGVSADDGKSHAKFASKHGLKFSLLSDIGGKVCKEFGVWQEKSLFGKKFTGIARTTFIIGKDGKVEKVFEKVNPLGHERQVLAWIKARRI